MIWENLESMSEFEKAIERSEEKGVAFFKHSTRCSVSLMAKKALEHSWDVDNVSIYFLDLIKHRDISNAIADRFGIIHQSPQLVAIKDRKPFYHSSHNSISVENLKKALITQ